MALRRDHHHGVSLRHRQLKRQRYRNRMSWLLHQADVLRPTSPDSKRFGAVSSSESSRQSAAVSSGAAASASERPPRVIGFPTEEKPRLGHRSAFWPWLIAAGLLAAALTGLGNWLAFFVDLLLP